MSDHEITLPPLPHRALRPGAGDDAMTDYARAAVLLDRQQRAAPSAEPVAWMMVNREHPTIGGSLQWAPPSDWPDPGSGPPHITYHMVSMRPPPAAAHGLDTSPGQLGSRLSNKPVLRPADMSDAASALPVVSLAASGSSLADQPPYY